MRSAACAPQILNVVRTNVTEVGIDDLKVGLPGVRVFK
jgi:hypothetical protein